MSLQLVAGPGQVSVPARADHGADQAPTLQQVAVAAPFRWPDHPLPLGTEDQLTDLVHASGVPGNRCDARLLVQGREPLC